MTSGDILGHEPMGIVEEIGSDVRHIAAGDRVVVPFNISCGQCFMCERGLQLQCETTQIRAEAKGAAMFGYTKLYGQVPGGQSEYLRVPQGQYGPVMPGQVGPSWSVVPLIGLAASTCGLVLALRMHSRCLGPWCGGAAGVWPLQVVHQVDAALPVRGRAWSPWRPQTQARPG